MKYVLYRSFGSIDEDVKKHELVGVEYGRNIDEVTDALVKDAAENLAVTPEYGRCETSAYAPEPIKEFRRVKRYQYEMMGIVYRPRSDKNVFTDFGVVEAEK